MPRPFLRLLAILFAALALGCAPAAFAKVTVSFHSFNGSVVVGRYPHTFVVLEGTEEATGKPVHENYGFSAESASPAVLAGPVKSVIYIEKEKWITRTNRHITVPISDEQYRRIQREVAAWRSKTYDLDTRNCIHFVGAVAQIAGLKVDYPKELLRKPRAWLNRVGTLNPQVASRQF